MKHDATEKDGKPSVAVFGHKHIGTREGGIEVVVTELYKRLSDEFDITVFDRFEVDAPHQYEVNVDEGYTLRKSATFSKQSLNAPLAALVSTIQCVLGKFDIVHVHAEGPCMFLWLLMPTTKKIVVTIHGIDWQRAKWNALAQKAIRFGEKCAVKYADEIIVLSESAREYFANEYGRQVTLIKNGVALYDNMRNGEHVLEELGLSRDGYFFIASRIVPEKRIDLAVDAIAKSAIDKKLVIAGAVTENNKALLGAHADDERVMLIGHQEHQNLPALYSNSSAVIVSSDLEGMSMSLLEAMAYGSRIVASDIPENVETLHGFGTLFKSGDADDLRIKLEQIASQPHTYNAEMAEFVRENLSWDAVARDTARIYRKLLEED